MCSTAGQSQCQATADRPNLSDDRLPGSPDISKLSSDLQQQWHVESNMHLGAIKVKPHSSIKAVWQCNKCPAGQPHIWTAEIASRTRGKQCPYCTNRRLCLHNSLATIAPDVAQYWNHSKNGKSPEQVLAGSASRAEWKCQTCKREWQAPITARVRNRSGCAKCSKALRVVASLPTIAEAQPACLAEWDYERNNAKRVYTDKITLGSNKMVDWICLCCPRGQPHRWAASPHMRISNGTGCAICAGKQVCVCNSLASLFPLVAAEFDADKNGFAPSEILAGTGKKVWWRNAKRGSWRQAVDIRTDKRLNWIHEE